MPRGKILVRPSISERIRTEIQERAPDIEIVDATRLKKLSRRDYLKFGIGAAAASATDQHQRNGEKTQDRTRYVSFHGSGTIRGSAKTGESREHLPAGIRAGGQ